MTNLEKNAIIVFSKFPEEGRVKTRLAESTSKKFAAVFYKMCAEQTFLEVQKLPDHFVKKFLFYSVESERQRIIDWAGKNFIFEKQSGIDLGEKMLSAFSKLFNSDYDKVIIIGTDLPDISVDIIKNAFKLLEESDVVIGPSADGGYYLLGMKQLHRDLFSGINWSTENVLSDTLKKISENKLILSKLQELNDIDTEDDLKSWLKNKSTKKANLKAEINGLYFQASRNK